MVKLKSVLLIEDDETVNFYNQFLIRELALTDHVEICENGAEALEYLKACENNSYPDLILLDINMPIMNGFEFLEEYENFPDRKQDQALIVMLTTSLHPDDRKKAETFSCVSEYVYKPMLKEKLAGLVGKYFSES